MSDPFRKTLKEWAGQSRALNSNDFGGAEDYGYACGEETAKANVRQILADHPEPERPDTAKLAGEITEGIYRRLETAMDTNSLCRGLDFPIVKEIVQAAILDRALGKEK
jgi:hypothetical protein